MFRRILLTALLAGGLAGSAVFGLQAWKVFPLILAAETYELSGGPHGHALHDESDPAASSWKPQDGIERLGYTLLADLLTGIGFASLLAGAIALSGVKVEAREGLLWGLAGFASFTVAPSLGLPPELPGMMAADLFARQAWWVGTALATAVGIALIFFAKQKWMKAVGAILMALPHIIGAPQGPAGGAVPPEISAQFVTLSIAIAGAFWAILGSLTGIFLTRFRQPAP